MGNVWIWLFQHLSCTEESPENVTRQSLVLLLIVFDYSIVLLSSSLHGNRFTKGGKARLQQAVEDRKHYPLF